MKSEGRAAAREAVPTISLAGDHSHTTACIGPVDKTGSRSQESGNFALKGATAAVELRVVSGGD